jgi:hypothetical protein
MENGIDAKVKIKAIKKGVDLDQSKSVLSAPIQAAKEEILVMFSTANSFHR